MALTAEKSSSRNDKFAHYWTVTHFPLGKTIHIPDMRKLIHF